MSAEITDHIQSLFSEWLGLQPLTEQNEKRLWLKFCLEWNYNSNHIEGNTLTYGETKLLFLHGQTDGRHTLREYEEMKAHDVAIQIVREMAREGRDFSEADIRNLNQIILKEPFWKEAITPDGQPTRKQIIPGQYKTMPNNVRTPGDEIFEFAPPMDVPPRMEAFAIFLRRIPTEADGLIKYLARLHHDFVLIHPFDDGNGRVARLLMNYALLRASYPPIVIKAAEKREYLNALQMADAGNLGEFEGFVARNLVWSLELAIKAAKGEAIAERDDVEKEIDLFVREQSSHKAEMREKNADDMLRLAESSWKPLLRMLDEKTKKIGELFHSRHLKVFHGNPNTGWEASLDELLGTRQLFHQIPFLLELHGYRSQPGKPFNIDLQIQLMLEQYEYRLRASNKLLIKKLYTEDLSSDETDQVVLDVLKILFEQIKKQTVQKR